MADKTFNHHWIGYCSSRSNLAVLINPTMSARRLNQNNILHCLQVIADQNASNLATALKVMLCKRKIGIVPRTQCLEELFLKKSAAPQD